MKRLIEVEDRFCLAKTIKGIAKITKKVCYHFSKHNLYEYAHTIYPVGEWKDVPKTDTRIKLKSMGPVGIQKYGNEVDIPKMFDSL